MPEKKNELLSAIARIDSLPSFPDVLIRFQNEVSTAHPNVKKLAAIIEDDPGLTARLLKTVNSAFYSRTATVTSISQAIARLGLEETRQLAVTTALLHRYKSFGGLMPGIFWTHSIAVALTSRSILQMGTHSFSLAETETAYVACLLHDVGTIVLFHLFEDECREIHAQQISNGGVSIENEHAQFGIHHGEAGEALLRNWNLPESLFEPIKYHHHPWLSSNPNREICYLVHLADFICNNIGAARMETRIETEFDESAFEMFHLTLLQVPDIIENVKLQAAAAESLVTLDS